jgi:hypothetical protein
MARRFSYSHTDAKLRPTALRRPNYPSSLPISEQFRSSLFTAPDRRDNLILATGLLDAHPD